MKKFGLLLVVMLSFLMLPFSVLADENTNDGNNESSEENVSKEVKVYFFYGDGCPHCANAEEFFDSIEEEYGELFELVAYETWVNSDNAALLEKIGEARDEVIGGVPYIIIGNKSWHGYGSDNDDEIIDTIKSEYETEVSERYDIIDLVGNVDSSKKNDYSDDIMILIAILIVAAGVVTGIVFARKKTA